MAAEFVRIAELDDARNIAEIQIQSWVVAPGVPVDNSLVPDIDEATRLWERAIFLPPSDRHQVWVATAEGTVVGAGAITPATDPDLAERKVSELLLFTVHPDHRRHGHGSRLLAALVSAMTDSAEEAVAWVNAQDDETRGYLEQCGWTPDGAHRSLSAFDEPTIEQQLRQVRLSTLIAPEAGSLE